MTSLLERILLLLLVAISQFCTCAAGTGIESSDDLCLDGLHFSPLCTHWGKPTKTELNIIDMLTSFAGDEVIAQMGWSDLSTTLKDLRSPRFRDVADCFCGSGMLSAECASAGLRCIFLDVLCNKEHDLVTTEGFISWIYAILSLVIRGVAIFGLPCQTFIWLSRGHTLRSASRPWGDCSRNDVVCANIMLKRTLILIRLCVLREVYFLLENPLGSIVWQNPAWRKLKRRLCIARHGVVRQITWFGSMTCQIAKPVIFEGIYPGVKNIYKPKPRWTRRPARKQTLCWFSWLQPQRDGTVKRRFMGKPALKSSGEYPLELCRDLVNILKWQRAWRKKGKNL